MNWRHVHLIFAREMRDQLRDRRTLFTITILPLLLYPLIGTLLMQVAQFSREQVSRVHIVGAEHFPRDLALIDQQDQLVMQPGLERIKDLVTLGIEPWPTDASDTQQVIGCLRERISQDSVDAAIVIPPSFTEQLVRRTRGSEADADGPKFEIQVVTNMARDRSEIAVRRVESIIRAWQQQWVAKQLRSAGADPSLVDPIEIRSIDTSEASVRHAMVWSKILPFVMLIWALTGAFYPAVDLCAGEKERGTLETLLSSPARRREIVWGKLLTVFSFSVGSALLNLFSMHLTASFVVQQFAARGAPHLANALGPLPIHAIGWLMLLLLPMAAFFSALAFAVAALARSTKEGQYYLMPLLLFTFPLVALPMIPSLDLTLATSLVPVSGAIFLVRKLIEGSYTEAFMHVPMVAIVTSVCCLLSVRWAVRQFESESVMFREGDRWTLRGWAIHLWRDRGTTASTNEAVLCGLIILVALFFAQFAATGSLVVWSDLARNVVSTQIGIILTPCLLMALVLTRSLRHALRLHRVPLHHVLAAVLLGIALHPTYTHLTEAVSNVFQIGDQTRTALQSVTTIVGNQPLLSVLLILALIPAVCEELTFRGFIFGGLLHKNGVMRAVLVSALFFGLSHTVLQQSISATIMGLLLGIVAWRTGSVLCTIIIHGINNTLSLTLAWLSLNNLQPHSNISWAVELNAGAWHYHPTWTVLSILIVCATLLILFRRDSATQRLVQTEVA